MPIKSPLPPIHSSLAADPVLAELVEQFVGEMPSRVSWLQRQLAAEDWEALRRAAHQMKGAAGSYGFDLLTPYAMRLEALLEGGASPQRIASATNELAAQCRRVTAAVTR
jgi:HPt (histidine-containing phosphotransfer) domain-containing protein